MAMCCGFGSYTRTLQHALDHHRACSRSIIPKAVVALCNGTRPSARDKYELYDLSADPFEVGSDDLCMVIFMLCTRPHMCHVACACAMAACSFHTMSVQ